METRFLLRLPDTLAETVREIEAVTGLVVDLARSPARPFADRSARLEIDLPRRIRILHPDAEIEDGVLIHEIIHARRNLLDSVPRLMPAGGGFLASWVRLLENDLEHLAVIPEEIGYLPAHADWWHARYDALLDALPTMGERALHFHLLRYWLVLTAVLPDTPAAGRAAQALTVHTLTEDADRFRDAIRAAASDKRGQIAAALVQFPFLRPAACLHRYAAPYRKAEIIAARGRIDV